MWSWIESLRLIVQDVSSRARRSLLPKNWEKALCPAARGLGSAEKHWGAQVVKSQNFPTVIQLNFKSCQPKRLFDSPASIMLTAASVLQFESFACPIIPVSHDVHHSTLLLQEALGWDDRECDLWFYTDGVLVVLAIFTPSSGPELTWLKLCCRISHLGVQMSQGRMPVIAFWE